MAMHNQVVVGVFDDRYHARQAVDELVQRGFRDDQIGVVGRDIDDRHELPEDASKVAGGAAAGAAAGAGIGAAWALGIAAGVLPAIGPVIAGGLLASVLASAAGGAAVAGIVGALIAMGVPEDEAEHYEREFREGRTLVTVRAGERANEALVILRRHGAHQTPEESVRGASA